MKLSKINKKGVKKFKQKLKNIFEDDSINFVRLHFEPENYKYFNKIKLTIDEIEQEYTKEKRKIFLLFVHRKMMFSDYSREPSFFFEESWKIMVIEYFERFSLEKLQNFFDKKNDLILFDLKTIFKRINESQKICFLIDIFKVALQSMEIDQVKKERLVDIFEISKQSDSICSLYDLLIFR